MSSTLRAINPYTKTIVDPRTKTVFGGLLAVTLLPMIMLGYTAWYVRDFIINERGTSLNTEQTPVNTSVGVRLDASTENLLGGSGQRIVCLAESGCWYTSIANVHTGQEDLTCPPVSMKVALENTKKQMVSGLRELSRGVQTEDRIKAGIREFTASLDDGAFERVCKYAKQGQVLKNSCMYYSPIPTDALTVTYHDNIIYRGDNTGLALFSPTLIKQKTENSDLLGTQLFGGETYTIDVDPMLLHYGVVSMNIIDTISENGNLMMNASTISKTRTLVPSYGAGVNSASSASDPVLNPCHGPIHGGAVNRGNATGTASTAHAGCAGLSSGRCVTTTITPGFMISSNTYQSQNIFTMWLASFGGILSLTMMGMAWFHLLSTKACGRWFWLCSPFVSPGEEEQARQMTRGKSSTKVDDADKVTKYGA